MLLYMAYIRILWDLGTPMTMETTTLVKSLATGQAAQLCTRASAWCAFMAATRASRAPALEIERQGACWLSHRNICVSYAWVVIYIVWLVVWIPLKHMKINWDDEIPNIWQNRKWQPNHQPVDIRYPIYFEGFLTCWCRHRYSKDDSPHHPRRYHGPPRRIIKSIVLIWFNMVWIWFKYCFHTWWCS